MVSQCKSQIMQHLAFSCDSKQIGQSVRTELDSMLMARRASSGCSNSTMPQPFELSPFCTQAG